ncbi:hypothetical protein NC652_006781 [Populus alba x Populus x berolinensis]|nr:hypothetical protein NC652_006781 [Populus alba x Populus x berolinensis]
MEYSEISFSFHGFLASFGKCTVWTHSEVNLYISEVRVEGLETLDYLDNLRQRERFTEQGDALTFESEVDRVYLSCPNAIAILDHGGRGHMLFRKDGLPDVVVEKPVTLKPGEEWTGLLVLSAVPSSFCSEYFDLERRGL